MSFVLSTPLSSLGRGCSVASTTAAFVPACDGVVTLLENAFAMCPETPYGQ